ncbi:MAG: MFS transporter [Chloroflexi bacterium]|nr:MFS transporter [Chloroflexota bacterium]
MSGPAARAVPLGDERAGQDTYRWVMLGLVWLLYASFGLVRSGPAPLVEPIVQDLRLTYTQMGTILGAWPLVYIGVAYLAGTILDRMGLRRALFLGALIIAGSGILRALAGDFTLMFLAVAVFGIGGPTISVGAPKLIAIWFRGRDRSAAASIYTTGSVLGGVAALATANAVLMPATGSWRATLAIYGLVALAGAFLWLLLARDPPRQATTGRAGAAEKGGLRYLLRVRNVQLVLLMAFTALVTNHGITNWLPVLLQRGGMTPAEAGYWASAPQIAGAIGVLFLPRLSAPGSRRPMVAGMLLAAAVSTVGLLVTSGLGLTIALLLHGISRAALTPLLMLVLMETPEVGPAQMGAAGGLYFTAGEIGGFAGPFLMGLLFDLTGTFAVGILFLGALNVALLLGTPLLREQPSGSG